MKKSSIPIEVTKFEKNYSNFHEFYNECEEKIYRKMIDVYEKLKSEDIKQKNLIFTASVDGFIFDTAFLLDSTNPSLLKEVIIPFFEDREDYETCSKILSLYTD